MRDDCITVLLGLEELAVLEQDELEDRIEVVVRYRRRGEQCPRCGSWTEKVHSTSRQRKRDRPDRIGVGQARIPAAGQAALPLPGLWKGVHRV